MVIFKLFTLICCIKKNLASDCCLNKKPDDDTDEFAETLDNPFGNKKQTYKRSSITSM